jgi:hypothetical protein
MNAVDIKAVSEDELVAMITAARGRVANEKLALAALENELSDRQADTAARLFQQAEKEDGAITFTVGGLKYKGEIKKTVKWDSEKLQAIAKHMDWAVAQRVFDITFNVPERTFNAMTDPALIEQLLKARTTKRSDLVVTYLGPAVG